MLVETHAETPSPVPDPNAAPAAPSCPRCPSSREKYSHIEQPNCVFTVPFILFAVLVIGVAAIAGAVQSGMLNKFFNAPKPAAQVVAAIAAHAAPIARVLPAAPLKPGAFVVTSISLAQPSFAIINGQSRMVGDTVTAPGLTGWKVKRIVDGAVVLENGSTLATLPLSIPGIKPLDDQLHPLN